MTRVDEESKKAAAWLPFLPTATDAALNQRSGTGESHKRPGRSGSLDPSVTSKKPRGLSPEALFALYGTGSRDDSRAQSQDPMELSAYACLVAYR